MKNKKKQMSEIANEVYYSLWFVKAYMYITKERKLCPVCKTNPKDKENPNSICFHCYYKQLTK